MSSERWQGMDPNEVIVILEQRLAISQRIRNEMMTSMVAALDSDPSKTKTLLANGVNQFGRSDAGIPPKRMRRRARRLQHNADNLTGDHKQ